MKIFKYILKVLGIILSVICTFLIFILSFFYLTVHVSEKIVAKNNVQSLVESIDILSLSLNDFSGAEKDITIKEFLYEEGKSVGVSKDVIDNIIIQSDYKEFLSTYISDYALYVLKGEKKPYLESNKIIDLFNNNNKEDIEKSLGKSLTDKEITDINKYINDLVIIVNNMIPDVNLENLYYIKYLFLGSTKITLVLAIIALTILIGLFRFNLFSPFKYSGISIFITGIVFTFSSRAKTPINELINSDNALVLKLLNVIGDNIFKNMFIFGIIAIIVSITLFVIGLLIEKKTIKKDNLVIE